MQDDVSKINFTLIIIYFHTAFAVQNTATDPTWSDTGVFDSKFATLSYLIIINFCY
jgi:hypothetical protein